ncbi:Dual specificity testis-specific protein kinase 2 [Eumeta japonica]|uniref:dual-specificity kinase n=1 Tax=Eumeta variegata TaxID=151549 RepID=A0A4C1WVD7_EUMVA|nr:Dual specificity testis-specific protein kinase 2 [Eumeta japonica]
MGACVHEGQLHALTEYMSGGSLEQLILGRAPAPPAPLPQPLRVSLAADVAAGMKYLHSLGVFHRDLTAKNVLLRKNGDNDYTAVVADFGLAAKIPHLNGYRLPSVGSPWWMSPECLRGRPYDHRSDIFSYGIVLCQLIARVDADPDVLPRTDNFGLNYAAFVELCDHTTVLELLRLAFHCCIYDPKARPLFPEIVNTLAEIKASLETRPAALAPPRPALCTPTTTDGACDSEDSEESGPRSYPGRAVGASAGRGRRESSPRAPASAERHAPAPAPAGPQRRPLHHRRSLSELEWWCEQAHTPPSDKARHHALPRARHASASALPPSGAPPPPASLARLADIMLLRDEHSHKHAHRNPFTALDRFRGVKKILEPSTPASGDLFSSCFELPSPLVRLANATDAVPGSDADADGAPRCTSLPGSPRSSRRASLERATDESPRQSRPVESCPQRSDSEDAPVLKFPLQLQKSNSSIELSAEGVITLKAGNAFAKRRGSCESGIFSVVNEDFCPQHSSAECFYGAMCPCSLMGCHRCWWWQRTAADAASDHSCDDECECKPRRASFSNGDETVRTGAKIKGEDSESDCSEDRRVGARPLTAHAVRMCSDCLLIYDRLFNLKAWRRADTMPRSANSSLFVLDDSALSTTTVSSLRSLDDLDEGHAPPPPPPPRPPSDADSNSSNPTRRATALDSEHAFASPFLCGGLEHENEQIDSRHNPPKEYHILTRCCCVSRGKCIGGCSAAGAGGSRGPPCGPLHSCKRTSSVYTDSSEDVASLAGSDSLYCDDRLPRHVRSAQISKIVEYFERKGGELKAQAQARLRAAGARAWGPGPLEFLQRTERKEYLVDVRHRLGTGTGAGADDAPPCGRKCLQQQRLTVCEGAVRSKLPLFDKKP